MEAKLNNLIELSPAERKLIIEQLEQIKDSCTRIQQLFGSNLKGVSSGETEISEAVAGVGYGQSYISAGRSYFSAGAVTDKPLFRLVGGAGPIQIEALGSTAPASREALLVENPPLVVYRSGELKPDAYLRVAENGAAAAAEFYADPAGEIVPGPSLNEPIIYRRLADSPAWRDRWEIFLKISNQLDSISDHYLDPVRAGTDQFKQFSETDWRELDQNPELGEQGFSALRREVVCQSAGLGRSSELLFELLVSILTPSPPPRLAEAGGEATRTRPSTEEESNA